MAKQEKYARLCKEKMAEEIISRINKHPNFVITSYMGSSTSDLENLRKNLKKASSNYLVVKNSILKVAFDKVKMSEESSKIDSGMGLSFSGDDIISTCKVLTAFAATHDKFKIKGAIIDGKTMAPDRIKILASLPPREVLLARALAGMKSPITGFVLTLSGVLRKFVYVVEAVKKSRQSSGAEVGAQEAKA